MTRIEFIPDEPPPDLPGLPDASLEADVPARPAVLPDGREVLLLGEPQRWDAPAPPGDSSRACGALLLLALGEAPPAAEAEPSVSGLAAWLRAAGVAAAVEEGHSPEDLAQAVEAGWGVIAFVNAGALWGRSDALGGGESDRAVLVTAVARGKRDGGLVGAYVRDPARTGPAAFVASEALAAAWLHAGGLFVVVSESRSGL